MKLTLTYNHPLELYSQNQTQEQPTGMYVQYMHAIENASYRTNERKDKRRKVPKIA